MTDAVAYHESLSAGWSQRYASGGFRRRAEFFQSAVLPGLHVGGAWLDVGCGSGVFSRMLAHEGASVTGVDGAQGMVEAAKADSVGLDIGYEVGKVEDLAAHDAAYDGAIMLSVLEYLPDPPAALAALARLVKPGGRLALSAPNAASTLRKTQAGLRRILGANAFAYLDSSRHLWTREALADLLRNAGFTVESLPGFDPLAPRPLWPLISPSLWFITARR